MRAHLRSCDACRDFQTTLKVRRRELAMLAPALSAGSAVAILQGVLGAGAAAGVAGGGGLAIGGGASLLGASAAKGIATVMAATAIGAGAVEIEQKTHVGRPFEEVVAKVVKPETAVAATVASASDNTEQAVEPAAPEPSQNAKSARFTGAFHSRMAGAGFEPAKAEPTRLQRVPFDRFGTPPGLERGVRIASAVRPARARNRRTSGRRR